MLINFWGVKYAQDLIAFDKKFSAMFSGKFDHDRPGGLSHEQFLAYVILRVNKAELGS